ncbi:MAG: ComEC/Rec2 family competence protein [Chloroflexota bacterium]
MNSIGLALSILGGCLLGLLLMSLHPAGLDPVYGLLLLALSAAAILAAFFARGSRRTFWVSLLAAFTLLGVGRTLLMHPPLTPDDLAYYNASPSSPPVAIVGEVSGEPVLSDRSQRLRISVRIIRKPHEPGPIALQGDMYAVVSRYPEYSVGESLVLSGTLTVPPTFSGFDYAAYLARQGIFSYMTFPTVESLGRLDDSGLESRIASLRYDARTTLRKAIAEPEAALTIGVVIGDRSSMSDEVLTAFKRSGTVHILAISGQNISLLVGIVWLLYSGGRRRVRMPVWLAIVLILLVSAYTLFTGASPSVVRAALMSTVLILAPVVGRRYDPMAALAISAALMVLPDPDLLADAGFQLSFASMFGIATISPSLDSFFSRLPHMPRLLTAPIAVGIGALATTWPITGLLMGQVSLVAPWATLTADFALAPLMITGILTILVGSAFPAVAAAPAFLAWLSSLWLIKNAEVWASLPWATFDASGLTLGHLLGYYGGLTCALLLFSNRHQLRRLRLRRVSGLAALACVAIIVWVAAIVVVLS